MKNLSDSKCVECDYCVDENGDPVWHKVSDTLEIMTYDENGDLKTSYICREFVAAKWGLS